MNILHYIAGVRVIDNNSCYSLQRLFQVLKYSSYNMFIRKFTEFVLTKYPDMSKELVWAIKQIFNKIKNLIK